MSGGNAADTFVFDAGRDVIDDFGVGGFRDRIQIDTALTGGATSGQAIVNRYASLDGDDTVLRFVRRQQPDDRGFHRSRPARPGYFLGVTHILETVRGTVSRVEGQSPAKAGMLGDDPSGDRLPAAGATRRAGAAHAPERRDGPRGGGMPSARIFGARRILRISGGDCAARPGPSRMPSGNPARMPAAFRH